MTDKRRRFLFVMQYPGYLRYFDSTVRGLAARGHHVDVVFDNPQKQAEGAEALTGVPGVTVHDARTPLPDDAVWEYVTRALRGTIDYVRYYHPKFAEATYLRERMRKVVPTELGFLARRNTSTAWMTRTLVSLLTLCERAVPSNRRLERFIESRKADAVLVTPLVTARSRQPDLVKAAQALGIPAAACIASWDHLTTKGLIRVRPDLVSVWNREQLAEAVEFHGIDPARIVVTGAQPFDRWFERTPTARDQFARKIGLSPDRPIVLFVGSTASISAPEAELHFVRRWIAALRAQPTLEHVGILVRPHPYNSTHWLEADFSDLPNVVIYPRGANPVNEADRQDYFDSLHHSAAVVGVNTTAMIEAAIAGRTVHSVLAPEFQDTQGGTLHFRYLLAENGGFLRVARSLLEHAQQVAETVQSPAIGRAACERFVERFVRPHGTAVAATPLLVDALEMLASRRRPRAAVPAVLYPLQQLLRVAGRAGMNRQRRRAHAAAVDKRRIGADAVAADVRADIPTVKGG
ncbi:MAG TPA: hypothetical protein VFD21_04420 [Vicinamibacterales bacterium]|jgi:hypothetical protein|nr:hypothetical protein [Vicinamibacterales bacterium]